MTLGYSYSEDAQSVWASVGAPGAAPSAGSLRAAYGAVAADLNRRGGILGRRIVLIGHKVSLADYFADPAGTEQESCTFFTQDHDVFAVLGGVGDTLSPCLTRAGVFTIAIQGSVVENAMMDRTDLGRFLLYGPGQILAELYAPVYVDRLIAQGYFRGWNTATGEPGTAPVKIGYAYQPVPVDERWYAMLTRALAARGYRVDPENAIAVGYDPSTLAANTNSAILRWRQNGVTHVFGAGANFSMFPAAESQHFRPRYAMDSNGNPALIAQTAPSAQLNGSLGVGWVFLQDLSGERGNPFYASPNAAQKRCARVMREAGVSPPLLPPCEAMWALANALTRAGAITPSSVEAGFNALGTLPAVSTFTQAWGPDRHAAASTVADMHFSKECTCYEYGSARTRL